MKTSIVLAAAAIFVGTAIAASPAQADDTHAENFSGTFLRTAPGFQSTWVVTSCGPGCAHVADSSGWTADAHPFAGLWRFEVNLPNATVCNNDGVAPGTVTFKVDPARNQGTFITTENGTVCQWGYAPGNSNPIVFLLTPL